MSEPNPALATPEARKRITVDRPGVYTMPAEDYLADPCPEPSLSATIAKDLCLASPMHAKYHHPRLTPAAVEERAEVMDVGRAAHALLLEGVSTIAVIDAKDFRTNAAKEARDQAYAAGLTPLLAARWADVQAMVGAARAQLDAHKDGGAAMFTAGEPEQTLIWRESDAVWCRARLDWLRPERGSIAGWCLDDYKTTGNANPDVWTKTLFASGLDIQAAWYLRGIKAVTGLEGTFRFAVQECNPPYALSVVSLAPDALLLAEKKCLYALDLWRDARASDRWPGYPTRTCYATLPPWLEAQWLEKELR